MKTTDGIGHFLLIGWLSKTLAATVVGCAAWLLAGSSIAGAAIPEEIRNLAPVLVLHPDERYMPLNPMAFIRESRFRWHKSYAKDYGWSKSRRGWVKGSSHDDDFYDIPVQVINSYGLNSDGANRRPRDANNGNHYNVFLEPRAHFTGADRPSGTTPVFVHWEKKGGTLLAQYWFFFGYSDGWNKFNHEGDWEVIGVHSRGGRVIGAQFGAHGKKDFVPVEGLDFQGNRVIGYCAKGTHAIYPKPGNYTVKGVHIDRTVSRGICWDTWRSLRLLREQPWRDFAGAWGGVGGGDPFTNTIVRGNTTGPLGPWHKLLKLGDFPREWGVVLFEHHKFHGRSVEITDNNPDLKRSSARFGDLASSLTYSVPDGWRLVLYKHDSYRVPVLELRPGRGSINDLKHFHAGDMISSVAWEEVQTPTRGTTRGGQRLGHLTGSVDLYEHHGFGGRVLSFSFKEDSRNLKNQGFGDRASSVRYRIPDGWKVVLYKHDSFREGLVRLRGSGEIHNLKSYRAGDEISSVRWERE